jgi:uncharacterized membrane protein
MNGKKAMGFAVAAAVVGMLATGYQFTGDEGKKDEGSVKCAGINSCKGHGACAAADGSHACAGKNECKGKGWVKVKSDKECTDKGGTVVKDAEKK